MPELDHIVVHAAPRTRSDRVVYLLNVLGLPYKVQQHIDGFPPQSAQEVHPTGRIPVLEVYYKGNSKPVVLAESGHIFSYLLRKFDPEHKLSGKNEEEQEEVDYWLHFAEASLMMWVMPSIVPWMMKLPTDDDINEFYNKPSARRHLHMIEERLAAQKEKGSEYLVGSNLTAADIMLAYPASLFFLTKISPSKDYPLAAAWARKHTQQQEYQGPVSEYKSKL